MGTLKVMARTVVRSQTVLERIRSFEGGAYEHFANPDPDSRGTTVALDATLWDDMGQPDVVTVTFEPGDHLNGPT